MKITFEADAAMDQRIAKVITHPAEQEHWRHIEGAIQQAEQKLVVINAKNNRNVQIALSTIAVIESEDRMCSVRVITGEMYLLNKRLKAAEAELDLSFFLRINNQTIINKYYIKEFSSTDNARLQVVLTNESSYYVSRFYIKNFRGNLV